MATTRIMPLHTGKGRTVGKAISNNPNLTFDNYLPCAAASETAHISRIAALQKDGRKPPEI